jgi:tetratricopeptide (TPR) repeat protein
MHTLIVSHQRTDATHSFKVKHLADRTIRSAPAACVEDPTVMALTGTKLQLGAELAWYLEKYLAYPYGPNVQRAQRVQRALRTWGERAFASLFGQGVGRALYFDAARNGLDLLRLVIASNDAGILSWPWEALYDPQMGPLAQSCYVERLIDNVTHPSPFPEGLPQHCIRILLITARPYENDAAYRSVSQPLVELVAHTGLPVQIKLLRPPTFAQLYSELQAHPGYYHIVHFDGHGSFGVANAAKALESNGPRGELAFERQDGSEELVSGEQLSGLLGEFHIPIVVLNACRSAMLNGRAEDAFASVATALLRSGVHSVIAMSYSLYVSAAREFLPAFYEKLFKSGDVAEATRAGRQAMVSRPERRRGFELEDWIVPVLYRQNPLKLPPLIFSEDIGTTTSFGLPHIPEEARSDSREAPYGIVGRDSAILALERASRKSVPALLIYGLAGVGKTALIRNYIQWLIHTQGAPTKVIWQSFSGVRNFDFVRNRLVEELIGFEALSWPNEKKWLSLQRALRTKATLIIWDNFENTEKEENGGAEYSMSETERQQLSLFLHELRGSATRILIASRSDEKWLEASVCCRIALTTLRGVDRQDLLEAILSDQGLSYDPTDKDVTDLADSLQGHPLMMRAILPRLRSVPARQLRDALEQYLPFADSTDLMERHLYATLRYVEEGLSANLRPLLYLIRLHESYVDSNLLAAMAKIAQQPYTEQQVQECLGLLRNAGLVTPLSEKVFELHPALTGYLNGRSVASEEQAQDRQRWSIGFIDVLADLADDSAGKEPHEKRLLFHYFGASFKKASVLADSYDNFSRYAALVQALAQHELNRRNLVRAELHYSELIRHCEQHGQDAAAAAAYHQLGLVAELQHDLSSAQTLYLKSVEIKECLGDSGGAAMTYHQLGSVAHDLGLLDVAEKHYQKALFIMEREHIQHGVMTTCHQLGRIFEGRRDFHVAELWYRKALKIATHLDMAGEVAAAYQQLGSIAEERLNFNEARTWHLQSLKIRKKIGDDSGMASSYHHLGIAAYSCQDFGAAEAYYLKALQIRELLEDEHEAAGCYHQIALVAQMRGDFDVAKEWYQKALEILTRLGDENTAAMTLHQLGVIDMKRHDFGAAEAFFHNALEIKERQSYPHSTATTYLVLGMLHQEQQNIELAENWYRKALTIFEHLRDSHRAEYTLQLLQAVRVDFH